MTDGIPARIYFVEQLPTVRRIIRVVGYRAGLPREEQREFASAVMLRLIEDDYALIRAFRGRSSFGTYLFVVVRRLLLDRQSKAWGKWRPTRLARELGSAAVLLERLTTRDGLSAGEAVAAVRHRARWQLSSADVWRLHAALPMRTPRPREVEMPSDAVLRDPERPDAGIVRDDLGRQADRVRSALSATLATFSQEDRRLLRMRFVDGMVMGQIGHMLGLEAASLYRRVDSLLRRLNQGLADQAITASVVRALLGHPEIEMGSILTRSGSQGRTGL